MIRHVLTAFFPELCLHCGEKISGADFFCTACASDDFLRRPDNIPAGAIRRKFSFIYEGPAKTLFSAAKFSERRRAVDYFIHATRQDLAGLVTDDTLFLVIPSRKRFLRRLISACLPKEKIAWNAFRFSNRKEKEANKSLGEADRYRRIHESLQWNSPKLAPAANYVICDDVSTTGATLNHAAHLIIKNLGINRDQITLWALMYRERHFLIPRQ